ncbi:hypothetical protein DI383_13935 [Flavobacteriaceae bacterium LYZ1037]|nr:hypothetical protein DI383_13935 [Flavobacteriaceae bacterium LYZ1037]
MWFGRSVSKEMVITFRIYVNELIRESSSLQGGAFYLSGYSHNFDYNRYITLNVNNVVSFRILPYWGTSTPAPSIS